MRPVLLALLFAAACSAPRQAERTPVPDDINAGFLDPDVDVDRYAERWELESREVYVARHDLVEALGLAPGDAVADVGTGTGLFLDLLADAVGPDGVVYALDISPAFVHHVARRVEEEGLAQVRPILSNARSTTLPPASIDAALVCDTYHHFEYHEDMLRSLRRALRPGGRLLLVDFERIPGVTREWVLGHVRAGREVFRAEIEDAGFRLEGEVDLAELEENYCLRFVRD